MERLALKARAICNSEFSGGGHPRHSRGSRRGPGRIAPESGADPGRGPQGQNSEDGLLDPVVIEDMGVLEVLKLAPTVLADSDYLDKEGVSFARAKETRVKDPGGGEPWEP
jgi:hypothetical protein